MLILSDWDEPLQGRESVLYGLAIKALQNMALLWGMRTAGLMVKQTALNQGTLKKERQLHYSYQTQLGLWFHLSLQTHLCSLLDVGGRQLAAQMGHLNLPQWCGRSKQTQQLCCQTNKIYLKYETCLLMKGISFLAECILLTIFYSRVGQLCRMCCMLPCGYTPQTVEPNLLHSWFFIVLCWISLVFEN